MCPPPVDVEGSVRIASVKCGNAAAQPGTVILKPQQQAQQAEAHYLGPPVLCAYEIERAQLIERNRKVMEEMGLTAAATTVKQSMQSKKQQRATGKRKAPPVLDQAPSRRSSRLASQAGRPIELPSTDPQQAADPETASLLTQEEYFKLTEQEFSPAMTSDGCFKGWVCPKVCEAYGIAGSASEAWEANGGGAWPDMSSVPAHLRAKGWSGAKAIAATMLHKSPNTYFYRHVAPHTTQAYGEWTQEEHELFMLTAKQFGVGDKWGLFSTYIPQRVGYQCSAYYRDVIVAQGLIADSRFRMTRCGKAVFIG